MRGFLDTLKTRSIGAAIATRSMQLDFAGASSVTVPRRNPITGTMTEPAWVGEGGVIPLQQFSFGSTTLSRYKLASIVPLTMELVEQSVPQAEAIMIDAMQEAYTIMLDQAIISAVAAVAGVRPAGLLNGVTVNAGDTTGGYESVVADMKTMMAALSNARLGVRPLLILNDQDYISASMLLNPLGQMPFQAELAGGRLMGAEVISSQNMTQGTAILVDAAAIATAFDGPQVRISQEATLTMANADGTAPTQAEDGAGALGTAGQVPVDGGGHVSDPGGAGAAFAGMQAMSMFQTYQEAIRGIWPTSWAIMRPGAVVALDNLAWG
jgi:HK97 family phage major capsid protein